MFRENDKIGQYRLIKRLGVGGFGEVWLAKKRSLFITKQVAIKLPLEHQIDLDAIGKEAALWEQASGHPNVLPIIDADIYDGQVAIVSEYVDGGSLHDKLQKEGKLSLKNCVQMTIGILKGLEYLHSKGIIHRDLKPQNILLQGDTPRIADFGISRANTSSTQTAAGTPAYMAPEAFDGHRNVQTDIWAVGVIMYEMLFGRLPFSQNDMASLMKAIFFENLENFPFHTSVTLQSMITKSLAKNPKERYENATEMLEDLQSKFLEFELMMETKPNNSLENHRKVVGNENIGPRKQHYYFAHQGLREVISRNPKIFIREILQTNSKRLDFEWVRCATLSKPEDERFIEAKGLTSYLIYFSDKFYGAFVRFPQPERIVEAYFAAIIVSDFENTLDRKFRYITLEVGNSKNGIPRTILAEWTESSHKNYGTGPDPDPELFLSEIEEIVVR